MHVDIHVIHLFAWNANSSLVVIRYLLSSLVIAAEPLLHDNALENVYSSLVDNVTARYPDLRTQS